MKKRKTRIIKAITVLLLILLQFLSLILIGYAIILYKGIETFYRAFGLLILLYLFFFISYLLLRSIAKKNKAAFLVPMLLSIILTASSCLGYYYLTKVYKAIDNYSETENMYYSSLVTYDKTLNNEKDLNKKIIGIVNDENDIEGYILPNETINELKLDQNNTIKKYDSTMELLYALKNKKVDAAFFSRNYVDMFSTMEDFETIAEDTKVLYEAKKVYESTEEDIKDVAASLDKPFSMLLIGVDSSQDGVTSGYNADVLLLATFNPKTLKVTLTSVPRDMYLKTACSNGNYRRINTTTWGSSSTCAVQTVENLFDVDIDYYAKINFKGVVQLVDAVGGIDVNVDYSICEQSSSRGWGKNTVYVEKGLQHLNGEQALALARNRHKPNDGSATGKAMAEYCPTWTDGSRSDYTRGKNQMKVILGIVNSATKIKDPNKVVNILETIKSNFQTNIKSKDLLSLYNLGKSIVVSDSSNLVNVQRMQLSGYNVWGSVYDPASKSYPAVTIPYKGSINDIKKEITANLNNTKMTAVKEISFDLNEPYKDTIIGQGNYSESKIATLKNVSSYTVTEIKNYASSNGLKLKFVDVNTLEEVTLSDWSNYSFSYQDEHADIILEQISTLTIFVKKKQIVAPAVKEETKPAETTDNNASTNEGTSDNNTQTGDNNTSTNTETPSDNETNNTQG